MDAVKTTVEMSQKPKDALHNKEEEGKVLPSSLTVAPADVTNR